MRRDDGLDLERTGAALRPVQGELYPGDPYFELEGRAVCEDCLGRYAKRYFAHRLRRVGQGEWQDNQEEL